LVIESTSSVRGRLIGARLTLAGAAVLAMALAGCGRKSGLDLPPAAVKQQQTSAAGPSGAAQPGGAPAPATIDPLGWLEAPAEEQPAATPGPGKKRIILDKILD
jgi:predicted small lipoprotein YifL